MRGGREKGHLVNEEKLHSKKIFTTNQIHFCQREMSVNITFMLLGDQRKTYYTLSTKMGV